MIKSPFSLRTLLIAPLALMAFALSVSAETFTYQNGTAGYSGNQGRGTTSFGGGTTSIDQYIASLGGQGRFVTPIRFNSLTSAAGWIDTSSSGYAVGDISLTLKVASNSLNGSGTLALVFNNRGANSAWVETSVTQLTLNGSTSWTGPGGTLTQAGSGVAPLSTSGAWDIGAANNGLPIIATAVVDNTAAVNSTVTFTFSGLSAAEKLKLIQIWTHNYGGGSLVNGSQTYTDNPGLLLSFSATSSYSTGDIRFYGDNDATVANRPLLSVTATASAPSIPTAPSGLAISTVSSNSALTLTWTDNSSDETGFKLERSLNGSTGWSLVATTAANTVTYTDTGLSSATTYFYRLSATNTQGDSATTSTVSATTLSANTVVTTYQNGTAGYTGNQGRGTTSFGGGTTVNDQYIASLGGLGRFVTPIRFNSLTSAASWIDTSSAGYAVGSISLTLKVASNSLNGSGTLALVFNNRGGNSAWTESGVTQLTLNGSTTWSGPGGTLTQAGPGVAPLSTSGAWDIGAANNGLPLLATAVVDNTAAANSTVTFTFSGLSAAEKLKLIQIWTHNYAGSSLVNGGQTYTDNPGLLLSFSATSSYSTGDIRFYGDNDATVANRPVLSVTASANAAPSTPTAPSGLAVSTVSSNSALTLSWTDNSSDETGFKLERSLNGSTGWSLVATPLADATTYTDTGLSSGTAYFYRLSATNAGGDSSPTSTVSATTWTQTEAWFASFSLPIATSLTVDGDADGLTNLAEFAFGGNPTSNASTPSPVVGTNGAFLTISFFRARSDLTYVIQGTNDLASTWSDLATNPGTVGQTVVFEDNVSTTSNPKRFLRVKITLP